MAEASQPERKEDSGFEQFRFGISHTLFQHREILTSILFAITASVPVLVATQVFPTAYAKIEQFTPLLAVVVFVLTFIHQTGALIAALVSVTLIAGLCHGALGMMVGIPMGLIAVLSIFGRFPALLVFAAPVLCAFCPLLIPVLAGFLLGRQRGPLWTGFAFLHSFYIGLFTGNERLGLLQPDTIQALIRQSRADTLGGTTNFITHLATHLQADPLVTVLLDAGQMYPIKFACQLVLWIAVALVVGTVYQKQRYMDQLATEYLRRAQVKTAARESKYRTMPVAVLAGTGLFILGYIVLSLALPGPSEKLDYNLGAGTGAFVDLLSGLALLGCLVFRYTDDPRFSERAEAEKKRKGKRASSPDISVPKRSTIYRSGGSSAGLDPAPKLKTPSSPKVAPKLNINRSATADYGTSDWKPKGHTASEAAPEPPAETTAPPAPADPSSPFRLNEKIDNQYTIDKIRKGGMGVVYIVTDEFSSKRYAVKSLKDDLLANREAVSRFEIEAKTWINLDHHENVVQAMLYRVIQNRPLLFLEYIEGTDLEHLLNLRQDYPIPQILSWFIQICRGMAYAHTKRFPGGETGIIHRDLKPANIMLTRDGVIKITDFGLAKITDVASGMTRESAGLGTLAYMPPEQLEDAKNVDRRADIYSFGALAYETLTGRPPFTSETLTSLAMSIMSKSPDAPSRIRSDIPQELDRIILRCLEKSREQRFGGFEEIEAGLTAIAAKMTGVTGVTPTTFPEARQSSPGLPSELSTPRVGSGPVRSSMRTPSSSRTPSAGRTPSSMRRTNFSGESLIEGVMFIDMVASTAKGSRYGDTLAMALKEELNRIVEAAAAQNESPFMKGTGDGFMVTFPDAEKGVRAAIGIMRAVDNRNRSADAKANISLRIGLHYGEVLLDSSGDRQGSTCNMASRVENVKPAEFHQTRMGVNLDELKEEDRIFISEVVQEEIAGSKDLKTRLVGFFDLKGFPGRHRIYEVTWK